MDDQYQPLHKQAVDLQYKFHDYVGSMDQHTTYDPYVNVLSHEIHHLVEDVASHKNPHALENRVKIIQQQLVQAQMQKNPMMNYGHINDLHRHSEQMRQHLHRFQHY